jgi:hypothetical protein
MRLTARRRDPLRHARVGTDRASSSSERLPIGSTQSTSTLRK